MTPLQALGVWCAGALMGLVAVDVLVGIVRGNLPPAVALGALMPALSGLLVLLLTRANGKSKDKD